MKTIDGDIESFAGAGNDGRYVYLVPRATAPSPNPWTSDGLVARFDTTISPTDANAWRVFETTKVNPKAKGFGHASWDGRFFYFMVGDELGIGGPESRNLVLRLDTNGDFEDVQAWSTFDLITLLPQAGIGPWGGGVVFDGQYVYIASAAGFIARFQARSTPKMPTGFSGTFY
jgi:hypothetical protein